MAAPKTTVRRETTIAVVNHRDKAIKVSTGWIIRNCCDAVPEIFDSHCQKCRLPVTKKHVLIFVLDKKLVGVLPLGEQDVTDPDYRQKFERYACLLVNQSIDSPSLISATVRSALVLNDEPDNASDDDLDDADEQMAIVERFTASGWLGLVAEIHVEQGLPVPYTPDPPKRRGLF